MAARIKFDAIVKTVVIKKKSTEFYIRNGGFYTLHEKTVEIVETKRNQKDFRDCYNKLWC
jgi:hypothetical protein